MIRELRKMFYPTKKKLVAFGVIVFLSLFMILGILLTDIVTYSVEWDWWVNSLMGMFSFTSLFSTFLQAPYFALVEFLPWEDWRRGADTLGVLVNSYILGCLIGSVWEEGAKSRKQKELFVFYILVWIFFQVGIFITFFNVSLWGFVVWSVAVLLAAVIVRAFKKRNFRIFKALSILTIIFSIGAFYLTVHNFEDAYCWDTTTGENFDTHMNCHENFDLLKAISETL